MLSYQELYNFLLKTHQALKNMGSVSEIRKKPIPDPGLIKSTGSWIRKLAARFFKHLKNFQGNTGSECNQRRIGPF